MSHSAIRIWTPHQHSNGNFFPFQFFRSLNKSLLRRRFQHIVHFQSRITILLRTGTVCASGSSFISRHNQKGAHEYASDYENQNHDRNDNYGDVGWCYTVVVSEGGLRKVTRRKKIVNYWSSATGGEKKKKYLKDKMFYGMQRECVMDSFKHTYDDDDDENRVKEKFQSLVGSEYQFPKYENVSVST